MNVITNKIGILLIISSFLISGCAYNDSVPSFAENNAVSAVGVNFDTGKIAVVNSDSGKTILPCVRSNKNYQSEGKNNCKTEIVFDKNNPALISAIELSRQPIDGMILKNGKEIPARFFTIVIEAHEGSICNTDYSGGEQYETCGRRR